MTLQGDRSGQLRADRFTPSPIFFAILAVTAGLAYGLWAGFEFNGFGVFLFVIAGWVLSLTLHEFAHAAVAYAGGDHSVADKGYLTLDVRRYAEPGMSLIFPIVILLIGGIGLPGGAVWINHGAMKSRVMRSVMSAAGPFANLVFAAACLLPIRFGWTADHLLFETALGFLGWIQVIAMLLNLMPVPGLDGFGIIDPHLSASARAAVAPLRQYGFMILLAVLWFPNPIRDIFWDAIDWVANVLGGDGTDILRSRGWSEFRFWQR